jgi:hypothetical protein
MEVHYYDVGIVMINNFQFFCIEDVPLETTWWMAKMWQKMV